jgi:DNA-binding XRE family transcriptional regulator
LKKLLLRLKITKYRLSKDTGITYQTLLNWAAGRYKPSRDYAIRVGKYLGLVTADAIEIAKLKEEAAVIRAKIARLSAVEPPSGG